MPSTETGNRCVAIQKIWREGAWPCFSPDGRQLVFTGLMDHPNNRLMMLPVEGGEKPRIITPPNMNAKRPTWLSTSTQIAFNRDQKSIWTIDLATDRLDPFLPESPPEAPPYLHPCAYPNERAVVVVASWNSVNGRAGVLYKLTPGADVPVMQLTTFPEVCAGRPGVSPDGETVVFAGNAGEFAQSANQLWVVTPNAKPRRLEQAEPALAQGRAPRWSPDGKWIACTSTRPSPNPIETTPKAIWIISADGDQAYRLTDHTFDPLHVSWSPDQKQLACGGFGCGLGVLDLPERFQSISPACLNDGLREETQP
jgi:Tol biopolymer transport system component